MKKLLRVTIILLGLLIVFIGCNTEPDIADGDIDLDTTYFPFGLGYEWCYARYQSYTLSGRGPEEDTSWVRYDTFALQVTDSFWSEDTLFFYVNGKPYGVIWEGKIPTAAGWFDINPEPIDTFVGLTRVTISYSGDTLILKHTEYSPYEDEWYDTDYSHRLKGIGTVVKGLDFWHYDLGISEYGGYDDRLLYFYNGQDTIYKSD